MELAIAVQQGIIEDFNRLEAENAKIRDRQSSDAITRINNHRQQGLLLMDYKEGVGHGRFLAAFQSVNGKVGVDAKFHCDHSTGARYMRIAKRFPDTVTDPREAIMGIVELWNPARLEENAEPQKLHEPNFHSQAVRLRQNLVGLFNHHLQRKPLQSWATEEIFDLLASFKPLTELCHQLESELLKRNDLPAAYRYSNGN